MKGDLLEELMYEYFTLKGYLCLRNLPGKPKTKGGRDEIDLIAIKIGNKIISEIIWVEVTSYLSKGKSTVIQKFSKEKEEYLRGFLKSMYGLVYNNTIKKIFFVLYEHPKIMENKDLPAKIITKKDILNELPNLIQKYKEKYCELSGSKSGTSYITLPESFKLTELIDTIRKKS